MPKILCSRTALAVTAAPPPPSARGVVRPRPPRWSPNNLSSIQYSGGGLPLRQSCSRRRLAAVRGDVLTRVIDTRLSIGRVGARQGISRAAGRRSAHRRAAHVAPQGTYGNMTARRPSRSPGLSGGHTRSRCDSSDLPPPHGFLKGAMAANNRRHVDHVQFGPTNAGMTENGPQGDDRLLHRAREDRIKGHSRPQRGRPVTTGFHASTATRSMRVVTQLQGFGGVKFPTVITAPGDPVFKQSTPDGTRDERSRRDVPAITVTDAVRAAAASFAVGSTLEAGRRRWLPTVAPQRGRRVPDFVTGRAPLNEARCRSPSSTKSASSSHSQSGTS